MNESSTPQIDPFEEQRNIYELLSQETRHLVLQYVLGHPDHLPSLDELDHMIPKSKAAISDQVENLVSAEILARYSHEPNADVRDLPSKFYGLTEQGTEILSEYNYLRGVPIARALYDNTRKPEQIERHENAPRPDLPDSVADALSLDEDDPSASDDQFDHLENHIRSANEHSISVDDQIDLARAFFDADILPDHEGIRCSQLADEFDLDLEYSSRTLLEHLVEVDVLEKFHPPGPSVLIISERRDEIVNGHVEEEAQACLEALVSHIEDEILYGRASQEPTENRRAIADGAGRTVRAILSEAFQVEPGAVEEVLRTGEPIETLNTAVDAIEANPNTQRRDDYGRILFVNPAYHYRLTEKAAQLVDRQ